jgi:hypothetical protein
VCGSEAAYREQARRLMEEDQCREGSEKLVIYFRSDLNSLLKIDETRLYAK